MEKETLLGILKNPFNNEWVSAMPRPAKDYEINDTIKKALECYNNEKSKK